MLARQVLEQSPHSGALFAFRGKRGDLVKLLWYDGEGLCLFSKRMDRGRFVWPSGEDGKVGLASAQLSMLLERDGLETPGANSSPVAGGLESKDSCGFIWHRWCRFDPIPGCRIEDLPRR